jgi:hypothetical protein
MIRLIVKLAAAALIANAVWHLGSAYLTFYRFKDAIEEAALFQANKSEPELRQRIVEIGSQYDLPITEDTFTLRRENNHTYIEGSYTQRIDLVPNYPYPWKFTFSTDTLVLPGSLK